MRPSRCHLFTQEVEYLGHAVRPRRISFNEKNIKATRLAVYPKTQTQLRSSLGICNMDKPFTKDFAKWAKPLNALVSSTLPRDLPSPTEVKQKALDAQQHTAQSAGTCVIQVGWPVYSGCGRQLQPTWLCTATGADGRRLLPYREL